jgi:hypothetical protein
MKKIIAIVALFVCCAGAAYSATDQAWHAQSAGNGVTFGTGATAITFKPSANVVMAYDGKDTTYSIGTYHSSGNRIYGTSSAETTIYYWELAASPGATLVTTPAIPAANGIVAGAFGTGWSSSK